MTQKKQSPICGVEFILRYSLPLLVGIVSGIVWANVAPESYENFNNFSFLGEHSHFTAKFWVNEVFMVLFFGLAVKEVIESTLPGGALNPVKKAINPLFATFGGVLGPACLYSLCLVAVGLPQFLMGWAIPTATDIALAWLAAKFIFGEKHPAVNYLLLLAIVDDALGLLIICFFYPNPYNTPKPIWLLLVLVAIVFVLLLRKMNFRSYWPYLLGPGVLSWIAFYTANFHPALALVPILPFYPKSKKDAGFYSQDEEKYFKNDTLGHFGRDFRLIVELGLFAFGIVNGGVSFAAVGPVTGSVVAGLVFGKTLGIFLFGFIATKVGFSLPSGMNLKELFVLGILGGLGLTVSIFLSSVAFVDPVIQSQAKMGALISVVAAPLAYCAMKALKLSKLR
jgi:Na+:H+ antiporter, NhaA family